MILRNVLLPMCFYFFRLKSVTFILLPLMNMVYRIIELFCKLNETMIHIGDLFNYLIKVNARYIRRSD